MGRWTRVLAGMVTLALVAALVEVIPFGPAPAQAAAVGPPATQSAAPVAERPDRPSALLTARVQGSRVEILSERTETTRTWANPDGTLTSDIASGPVRVNTSQGWQDIDPTLVADQTGVHPKVARAGVRFSPGGSGDAATLTVGSRSVGLGWTAGLPTPTLNGAVATYRDVTAGADLELQALSGGFAERLVLRTRPAVAPVFQFPLRLTGLSAAVTASGRIALTDSSGRLVAQADPPRMWGAERDPNADEPTRVGSVAVRITGSVGDQVLEVAPDPAFLADPKVAYPVTIDPSPNLAATADTFIDSGFPDSSYASDPELKSGTYNSGANKLRTLMKFDASPISGTQVLSATLKLYEFWSWSCSARQVNIYRATSNWSGSVTWNTRPSTNGFLQASANVAKGHDSGCPAGWVSFDLQGLAQAWADGSVPNYGFYVQTASETDNFGWKKFHSYNYGSNVPVLTVTYNSYPNTPTNRSTVPSTACVTGTSRPWINTTTPTLKAVVSDPDGGSVYGNFDVWPTGGSGSVWSGTSAAVTSGGTAAKAVASGALAGGGTYSWRVRGWDGSLYSKSWTSWCEFTVDTTKPVAPGISSVDYPQGQWNLTGGPGSFTLTSSDTGSGVASWRYWLDSATPSTASGGSPTSVSITPPNGWHTLHVQALDKAGNLSQESLYAFGAVAGVTSPTPGQRSQRFLTLGAVGPPAASGVRFQYQLPGTTTWTDIPTGQVTLAGAPVASWPVATVVDATAARAPANLVWDVRATMSNADGPIAVQAVLTSDTSSWTTDQVTATLDQQAFGDSYATDDLGPGAVSLLTGNYSVSATDASIAAWGSDATISRTFNSLSATQSGIFGPGWQTSLAVEEADSEWTGLADTGSGVVLTDVDGGLTVFAKSASGYAAQGDAAGEGLALAKTASPDEFTISDLDGNQTTLAFASGPATPTLTNPRLYRMSKVTQPGSNQVTTYAYNADGTPAQILLPKPTTSTVCDATTWSPGCRALQLTYTAGKVTKLTIKTTDGAGAVKVVDTACYTYDAAGRLSQAWDPRISGTTCASPVLATTYTYDTAGRLATVTPAGLAGWTISYDPQGRLDSVSRTHNAANGGSTETETVRYDVPFDATTSTDESHPDLSAGRVAAWAQTDLPVTATAVFGPGDTVSSTDLRDGQVHALDVNGREVNTAAFSGTGQAGWKVTTSEYDQYGNTVRELSAANRDLALTGDPTSLGLPADIGTAAFAQALDERSLYAADGTDLLDSYGPLHTVAIDGGWVNARQHTHTTYGTLDAPGTDPTLDGPKHLEVTSTVAASQSADTTPTDETDLRTTRTAYGLPGDATGWTLKQPMRVTTVMPGGTDIVNETLYNPTTGLLSQTRMPSAAGSATAVGTTKTTYYVAGTRNDAACVNSAWVNLACKAEPGSQPATAGLPKLPVTQTTYDWLGRPTTVTETVIDATGATQTRTTTSEYENAGWSPRVRRSLVTSTIGTAVPAILTGYDPASGLTTSTATDTTPAPGPGMAGTMTSGYDDFGRTTSFTDADGATTLTTYTPEGRVGTVTTKTPAGQVLGTTTFGYNAGSEHRGLTTSITDTALSGAITGTYDADAQLVSQAFPTGMTQTTTPDTTGDPTQVIYAKGGVEWVNDSQSSSIHGQQRWHTGPAGWELYGYDAAGRLATLWDQRTGQPCVQRGYSYDLDSNRTAAQLWPADATGNCPPATTQTDTTHTYDPADRLLPQGIDAGLTYDGFGRTTTLPAPAAGGTTASTTYYATDMVAGQTQGTASRSWTLDPAGRLRQASASDASTRLNHYDDASSDAPAWIDEDTGAATLSATRYVAGLDGNLAAAVTHTGTTSSARWQLVNLHGDVVSSAADDPALTTPDGPTLDADEFGIPRGGATARYGWLGGKQRSTDTLGGLVLMGVRLYNPTLGRFLQVDPVPGGSANDYDYASQDPINNYDLDGNICWRCHLRNVGRWAWRNKWDIALTAASFIPGAGAAAWAYRGYRAYRAYRSVRTAWRAAREARAVWRVYRSRHVILGVQRYRSGIGGRGWGLHRAGHGLPRHISHYRITAAGRHRHIAHYRWWGRRF
jgi:RHS repeat-associated protein